MKRLGVIVMAACLLCGMLTGCKEQAQPVPQSLKILCIGNSFSCDTIEHVADIAKDLGVQEIKLGNLYIGGCSIRRHYQNAVKKLPYYEYFVNTGNGWSSTNNHIMLHEIQSDDWDYIVIQHGTADGSRYAEEASYGDLQALVEYVRKYAPAKARVVFNMTWVGEAGSHEELTSVFRNDTKAYYEAIAALTKETVVPTEGLDAVSPTGTAIQNARTTPIGILTRDNYHLNYGIGRYIAGLTLFKTLTGADISAITWTPDGVTDKMREIAVAAANAAVQTPFEVTDIDLP